MDNNIDGSNITPYRLKIFNKEIERRKHISDTPLSKKQKIKAARRASHSIFPSTIFKGHEGHVIREAYKSEILKTVGVKYYLKPALKNNTPTPQTTNVTCTCPTSNEQDMSKNTRLKPNA